MFKLQIKRRQLRVIENLNTATKRAVHDALTTLKLDPVPAKLLDVQKLRGYENVYRIRVGDTRVVYEVDWDEKLINIQFVGHRSKAYRSS